jgi:hypothetical protein
MKVYDGSAWEEVGADAVADAQAIADGIGNLDSLSDVSAASPSDDQVLQYNSATSNWEATTLSIASALNDLTDVDTTGVVNGQTIVYNSSTTSWEPGESGGNTAVVGWENQVTVAENYTITSGNNMVSAGPITIDTGYTVTVPTGSRWVVV